MPRCERRPKAEEFSFSTLNSTYIVSVFCGSVIAAEGGSLTNQVLIKCDFLKLRINTIKLINFIILDSFEIKFNNS